MQYVELYTGVRATLDTTEDAATLASRES